MRKYKMHICEFCDTEYRAFKDESRFCGRHRHMQSPARIALREFNRVNRKPNQSPEVTREKHRLLCIDLRRRKGINARVKSARVVKEKKSVTRVQDFTFRPAVMECVKDWLTKPPELFFLQVNRKTRYSFSSLERLERFKERHPDLVGVM